MPLALLAVLNTAPAPSLVIIDDNSILNYHVSGMIAPRLGYTLRTHSQRLAEVESGRVDTHPAPRTIIAVHQDLDSLKYRIANEALGSELQFAWNHVEDVREEELPEMLADPPLNGLSATMRLPGFPGAVGVLITREKRNLLMQAAAGLGLDYQGSAEQADHQDRTSERDPTRI